MTEDVRDPLRDDDEDERPKSEGRQIARRASEVRPTSRVPQQTDVPDGSGYEDPSGTRFLSHLQYRSPFWDYFCRVAEASYVGKAPEPKIRKAQQEHPALYRFCVVADMALRIVVTLLLLAVTMAVAYKTLWPLSVPGN